MSVQLSKVMSLGMHEKRKSIKIIFAQQWSPTFYCYIGELAKQKSFNYVYVRLSLLLFSFLLFFSSTSPSFSQKHIIQFLFIIVNSLTRYLSYRSQKHTTTIIQKSFLLITPPRCYVLFPFMSVKCLQFRVFLEVKPYKSSTNA